MRLAFECPTEILEEVQPLADFDWILAHLVLEDEQYARYYGESTRLRVLDNSVNELLQPCSILDIQEADIRLGRADLIVAPDYLGDSSTTERALDEIGEVFESSRLLPVVQGSGARDVKVCAEFILSRHFRQVAVPYDILCKRTDSLEIMARSRSSVVRLLSELGFTQIHLLGMTTIEELHSYWGCKGVESVDTGGPILNGLRGRHFGRDSLLPKVTPTLEQMPSKIVSLEEVYYNIAYLRKIIQ